MVNILRVVEALPHGFDVMCAEAAAEGVRNMAMLAAQNLVAGLQGKLPPNLINPEARR